MLVYALPLNAVTLSEVIKESGCVIGRFIMWHLGYKPPRMPVNQSFNKFRGFVSRDGDQLNSQTLVNDHKMVLCEETCKYCSMAQFHLMV